MIYRSNANPISLGQEQVICILGSGHPGCSKFQVWVTRGVISINGFLLTNRDRPYQLQRRRDILVCPDMDSQISIEMFISSGWDYYYVDVTPRKLLRYLLTPMSDVVLCLDPSQFVFESFLHRYIRKHKDVLVLNLDCTSDVTTPTNTIGYVHYISARMHQSRFFFLERPTRGVFSPLIDAHLRHTVTSQLRNKGKVLVGCFNCAHDSTYPQLSNLIRFFRGEVNDMQIHVTNDERMFHTQIPIGIDKAISYVPLLRTYLSNPYPIRSIPPGIRAEVFQAYRLPPVSCLPLTYDSEPVRTLLTSDYWSESLLLLDLPEDIYFSMILDKTPAEALLNREPIRVSSVICRLRDNTIKVVIGNPDLFDAGHQIYLVDTRISSLCFTTIQ